MARALLSRSTPFLSLLDVQQFCNSCPKQAGGGGKDALIDTLKARIDDLNASLSLACAENIRKDALIRALQARVGELEASLGLTSGQVEKLLSAEESAREQAVWGKTNVPPSKRPLADKAERMAQKKKADKRRRRRSLRDRNRARGPVHPKGGQQGHPGKGLSLPTDCRKEVFRHCPAQCEKCALREECLSAMRTQERRHAVDIRVETVVTSHEAMSCLCPIMGERLCGTFPEGVTASKQYGPNATALAATLFFQGVMGFERVAEILNGLGLPVSTSTVHAMIRRLSEHPSLQRAMGILRRQLLEEHTLHADESGNNVDGELYWIHVLCSPKGVHYHCSPDRGSKGMQAGGLLASPVDTLVHDCLSAYWNPCLSVSRHALCGAHLVRELHNVEELDPTAHWAQLLLNLLLRSNDECWRARKRGQSRLSHYRQGRISRQYDELIARGKLHHPRNTRGKTRGRIKQPKAVNLLERLEKYKDAVLLFTRDLDVPFTNNLAEQALRPLVLREKVSGYFATPTGARNYLKTQSYLETAKRRGIRPYQAIRLCLEGRAEEVLRTPDTL